MKRRVLSSKDSVRLQRNRCEFERTNETPNTYIMRTTFWGTYAICNYIRARAKLKIISTPFNSKLSTGRNPPFSERTPSEVPPPLSAQR